jgi:elongator complex protein 1
MALYDITVQESICDVAFCTKDSSIAVLHQRGIAIYTWDRKSAPSPPALTGRVTFKQNNTPEEKYQQICFGENQDILILGHTVGTSTILRRYGFNEETGRVDETEFDQAGFSSISMISSFDHDGLARPFAQAASGELYSLSLPSFGQPLAEFCFPSFLAWAEVIDNGDQKIAVGLSESGHLYANSRLLVKNCTSFLLTPLHLVFTTTNHLLKFVHITNVNGKFLHGDLRIFADLL